MLNHVTRPQTYKHLGGAEMFPRLMSKEVNDGHFVSIYEH